MSSASKFWKFGSLDQEQFVATAMHMAPTMLIKEMTATGARVYFTPRCNMVIPTQLWEETRDAEGYVYSRFPVGQYVEEMRKVVSAVDIDPCKLVLTKASVYTSSIITHGTQYSIKVCLSRTQNV